MTQRRKPLSHYLSLSYPFSVHLDEHGYHYIEFPDLPGCFTGAETLEQIPAMIREAVRLWMEAEHEAGRAIPEPTVRPPRASYSGRFNLRLPRSLHRELTESAEREGTSLNQYVVALLARGDAQEQVHHAPTRQTGAGRRVADSEGRYDASVAPRPSRKQT